MMPEHSSGLASATLDDVPSLSVERQLRGQYHASLTYYLKEKTNHDDK